MRRARCVATAVVLVAASACSSGHVARRAAVTTTTSTSTSTPSTSTTSSATTTAVALSTTSSAASSPTHAAASCPPVPARAQPRSDRSRYTLAITVDPAAGTVDGKEGIDFTPDLATDRIVLRVWANGPRIAAGGGHEDVATDGMQQPDTTTVVIPRSLAAGQTTHVDLTWHLKLPGPVDDRISVSGTNIRLGSFFPIVAWEPGVGWALDPPTAGFAEASLSVASDFDVSVAVPADLNVLATGVSDRPGHWTAPAVPDFALSIGHFVLATGTAHAPDPVAVTVGIGAGVAESPQPYLAKVIRVLEDFGRRFGPYAWPAYTLAVTPNLKGGIEYPMHVMQGPGHLGRTTSHEIGHQWFFGLVENDQGRDPWIDEGLASYAEARFEGTLGSFEARAVPTDGRGRLGEPMTYWEPRPASYYRSVYVQGVQAVAALGPPDLVDCALRHLVARQAYRVTRDADVIAALADVFPDAAAVLARYGVHG